LSPSTLYVSLLPGATNVLATLEAHTTFVCERPAEDRKKLRSVQAVMDAFPNVRLVIDAKEQRIQVFRHDRARHSGLTRTVLTNFADGAPERMAWHIAVLSLPALAETASADEGLPTGL